MTIRGLARRIAYPMQNPQRVARAVVGAVVSTAVFGPVVLVLRATRRLVRRLEVNHG